MKKLIIIIILALIALPLSATVYYVADSDGSDAYNGLFDSFQGGNDGPWLTIGYANGEVAAGDTVYIRTGTYTGTSNAIEPGVTGTSGNYITYENYTGEEPNLQGYTNSNFSGSASKAGMYASGKNYIKIKGLKMDNGSQAGSAQHMFACLINADNCVVENCTFKYLFVDSPPADSWNYGILADGDSDYLHVKNCDIQIGGSTYPPTDDQGDGLQLLGDYALIEDNYFDYWGHQCIVLSGDYCIIRNNTFKGTWGRTTNDHGDHNVWDSNTLYDVNYDEEDDTPNHAMQWEDNDYSIIRRNIIYDVDGPGVRSWADQSTDFGRFYHNIIYNAGRDQYANHNMVMQLQEAGSTGYTTYWVYRNNIFYNCDSDTIEYWGLADEGDYDFNYNHWEDDTAGAWDGPNDTYGDPKFVNPTSDFHLQSDSPCINSGDWLTTITSVTGSGTSFVVDDAGFFCDGYGIVTGDEIQLEGDLSSVTITAINYGTDTITVNVSVGWTQGDGVALPYNGPVPDMGTYEYGDSILRIREVLRIRNVLRIK